MQGARKRRRSTQTYKDGLVRASAQAYDIYTPHNGARRSNAADEAFSADLIIRCVYFNIFGRQIRSINRRAGPAPAE